MNLLLLPGNSKRHKQWITEVERELAPLFSQTYAQNYRHWDTGDSEIDLAREVEQLSTVMENFGPYCVFAKSAGSILASKAAAETTLQPKACLFTGFPLEMVVNHNLPADDWLRATEFPVIILQNEHDPLGSFNDVAAYFKKIERQNVSVHSLPGETHNYLDFAVIKEFAAQLPKS